METPPTSVFTRTTLFDRQVSWVHQVIGEGQLLADLAFADIVIWAPTQKSSFVAVCHLRPSSSPTLFYRDIVESEIRPEWSDLVVEAFTTGKIVDSKFLDSYHEVQSTVRAVPIRMPNDWHGFPYGDNVVAVLTRHSNLTEGRVPGRQELTFKECANDLFRMVSEGSFPDLEAPGAQPNGAPRASDGLITIDEQGLVTFASPNALSSFRRLGFQEELEGKKLAEVTSKVLQGVLILDEALPLLVTGRTFSRSDMSVGGVVVALRGIPLRMGGKPNGAIILNRDVTQLRLREQELMTKDAIIREIHHRVKNNLQTVASLLRIQSRRFNNEETKEALGQATRRVEAIAVVHDTLSRGLSQSIDFDDVFDRVLRLVAEVASKSQQDIRHRFEGTFGVLPSEYATPLALVLAELVSNAVEHGFRGRNSGEVTITSQRLEESLAILVRDNGVGLTEGKEREGLGSHIVRTLVRGELGGTIEWHNSEEGTEVKISIPMRFLHGKIPTATIPNV